MAETDMGLYCIDLYFLNFKCCTEPIIPVWKNTMVVGEQMVYYHYLVPKWPFYYHFTKKAAAYMTDTLTSQHLFDCWLKWQIQNKKIIIYTSAHFYTTTLHPWHCSVIPSLLSDPGWTWERWMSLFAVEGVGTSCVMISFLFPVTVESTGILPPDVLVAEAIQVLMVKCQTLLGEMNSTDVEWTNDRTTIWSEHVNVPYMDFLVVTWLFLHFSFFDYGKFD